MQYCINECAQSAEPSPLVWFGKQESWRMIQSLIRKLLIIITIYTILWDGTLQTNWTSETQVLRAMKKLEEKDWIQNPAPGNKLIIIVLSLEILVSCCLLIDFCTPCRLETVYFDTFVTEFGSTYPLLTVFLSGKKWVIDYMD